MFVNKLFTYFTCVYLKNKRIRLNYANILVLKFDKAMLKKQIELIIRNSLIERLFNFHAVFSNSDRKRYVQKRSVTLLKKRPWQEFCEISKTTFCYRTPPVAASV